MYKGATLASTATGPLLYVANFCGGTIEVYDGTFTPVALAGSFADPNIPAGFAPFNIRNLDGTLYVTFYEAAARVKQYRPWRCPSSSFVLCQRSRAMAHRAPARFGHPSIRALRGRAGLAGA